MAIINDGRKHGRRCYNDGCTCPERAVANRAYQRERRDARKAEAEGLGKLRLVRQVDSRDLRAPAEPNVDEVFELPPIESLAKPRPNVRPRPMGKVALAIYHEICRIPGALDEYPGLVELALTMADQIDSGDSPQPVSAAKEIKLMLADMRPAKPVGRPGRVAGVEAPSGQLSPRDAFIDKLTQAL